VGRRRAAALTVLAALAAGAGCGPFGDGIDGTHEPLADAVEEAGRTGESFRLSSVTDFEWDRAYVFAPYTPTGKISRELGFEWDGAEDSSIEKSDFVHLLVFVDDGDVALAFDHGIEGGQFTCLAGSAAGGLTPTEAVLRVTTEQADDGSKLESVCLARRRD
jgi:hypothetical protein